MTTPLESYALLGDLRTAALVSRDGSIDWLCVPRFDGGACFAALVGDEANGRWSIAPADGVTEVRRRYRPGTLVLETEMATADGAIRIVDAMPPDAPQPTVVRQVIGLRGCVEMAMRLVVRFDYGSIVPWVTRDGSRLRAVAAPDSLTLDSPVPLRSREMRTTSSFRVDAGDQLAFTLVWAPAHEAAPAPIDAAAAIDRTTRWWEAWSGQCAYEGRWREPVLRSLITLKALTYAPTGGIVAAPTTSLPEQLGGVRNWDYRYCWIRDATFSLYALLLGGYVDEARRWRDWLLRVTAGHASQLNVAYGVAGERRLPEFTLDWLEGYASSRPVRIGNGAAGQVQHDVVGEVLDAMHFARRSGLAPDPASWSLQRHMVDYLAEHWQEPDRGIWEVRGPERPFTHSRVMAWVAFDRAVKAVEGYGLPGPVERWREIRAAIHAEVCEHGFSARQNAFVQAYDLDELDASLLMIPLVGFLPVDDPRVAGTVAAIERELTVNGIVRRYRTGSGVDGLPGEEGAFLPCSFWLVDCLALQGRRDEAERRFEHLLGLASDVGLLGEEYSVSDGRLVGNYPQAFTHVALVNTAMNLGAGRSPAADRAERAPGTPARP